MELKIFFGTCYTLSLAVFISARTEIDDNANLIITVFKQTKESSVIIFYHADNDFYEKDYFLQITKSLSEKKIVSTTTKFREWHEIKKHYWEKNKGQIRGRLPMIVIVLSDEISLTQFQEMYKELRFEKELLFLVLIIGTDEHLQQFCSNPENNYFKLRIDALMIIKCFDDNKLRALYTLDGERTVSSTWAIWDPNIGFLTMILNQKNKKINLHGKELKIATVESSALTDWTQDNKLDGYFGQVLSELQRTMNFTWKLIKKETEYGSWNATGNFWTGAVNLLYLNKIDLLVTDLALTSLRMTVIDYTLPILSVKSMLYVQKPQAGVDIKWSGYFKFFDVKIWVALISLILITPLILTVFKMKIRDSYVISLLLLENYLNIWGIYCQQGLLEFPAASALRLIYFSVFVSALIIYAYYSAILISRLTYPTPDHFMPDMEAFIADGSYKLITLKNGADYNIFEFGKTNTLRAMFDFMLKTDNLPESVQAGFDMVCNQKVGFFVVETARNIHNLNIKCKLHEIKTNLLEISTMALPKNSELKNEINRIFLQFEINGMMKRFYEEYFYHDTVIFQSKSQVSIWEIVILLSVVACGFIVSLIVLLIEHKLYFLHKMTKGRGKSSKNPKQLNFENLTKWYNFEKQKLNPDRYNQDGDLNVKFVKKDHKHKFVLSPSGMNRISFEF